MIAPPQVWTDFHSTEYNMERKRQKGHFRMEKLTLSQPGDQDQQAYVGGT